MQIGQVVWQIRPEWSCPIIPSTRRIRLSLGASIGFPKRLFKTSYLGFRWSYSAQLSRGCPSRSPLSAQWSPSLSSVASSRDRASGRHVSRNVITQSFLRCVEISTWVKLFLWLNFCRQNDFSHGCRYFNTSPK